MNEIRVEKPTKDILHCIQHRTFWISFISGLIQVGMGEEVGKVVSMEYLATETPYSIVKGIGLSTGYGFSGEFKYENKYGTLPLNSLTAGAAYIRVFILY